MCANHSCRRNSTAGVYPEEKALIDSCETNHPEISHSPLNKILYGHPYFKGFFPACQSPIMHLKGHVESRVLGESQCL